MPQTQHGNSTYGHHPGILRAPLAAAVAVWRHVSGTGSAGVNPISDKEPGS